MGKMSKSMLFNLCAGALTILGMILSSKAQEEEIEEIKQELRLEMKQEKEKK